MTVLQKLLFSSYLLITLLSSRSQRNLVLAVEKNARIIYEDSLSGSVVTDEHCPSDNNANPIIIPQHSKKFHYDIYPSLACFASYPITIEFEGVKPSWVVTRHLIASADFLNQTKPCYIIFLTGIKSESVSPIGTYFCKSLQEPHYSSFYAISTNTNGNEHASNWGKFEVGSHQQLFINPYKLTEFTIPCSTSDKISTDVALKKIDSATRDEMDVDVTYGWNITYDQR